VDIGLYKLHAGQRTIGRRGKRFNGVRCGRRFGKTKFGLHRLVVPPGSPFGVDSTIPAYPTAWFAPTYKYLFEVWREANHILANAIASRDKTERTIRLKSGQTIDFWTLDDADAGRGRKYKHVVIDEAAKVRKLEEAWNQSIRPTLTDYRGSADFLSTPKGRDFFAEICDRGTWVKRGPGGRDIECLPSDEGARPLIANKDGSPKFPDYQAFHMPTSANPYIPLDEIEVARLELPELVFRQEYLAEFVDFAGTVIKRGWLRWGDPLSKWKEEQLITCIGGDLAISQDETADYTAAVVLSKDPDGFYWVRWAERDRLTFRDQMRMFGRLMTTHKARSLYLEDNQYQAVAVQEMLTTTPFAVFGHKSDRSKYTRFMPVQARFERGMVVFEEHLVPSFEGEILSFTGDEKSGEHDDYVDALGLAFIACNAAWVDQPQGGAGDRVATAGASADLSQGWGTAHVHTRR
jgi:predicted phage terminase large subunit-like protein